MSRPLILKRVANRKDVLAIHDAETGEVLAGQMSCEIVNNIGGALHAVVHISLCGVNKIVGDDNETTKTSKQTTGDDTQGIETSKG